VGLACKGGGRPWWAQLVGQGHVHPAHGRRRQGHGQRELRALAQGAVGHDVATHGAGDFARDRQPQARALVLAPETAIHLVEGVEHQRQVGGRDAGSGVRHLEGHVVHMQGGRRLQAAHAHAHLALFGELHRVAHQVVQDLAQPGGVALHPAGVGQVHLHGQAQALVGGGHVLQGQGVAQHALQLEGRALDGQLARLDA